MTKKAPENTAAMHENGAAFLAEAMLFGPSAAIERQESAGQSSFVVSDTLPTELFDDSKAALEAAGVKFLGPVEGDDLFQYVELPPGWQKRAVDHPMWSALVDDKGRKRASIFYKAAFYDRAAHLQTETRFTIRRDWDASDQRSVGVFDVLDGHNVIHRTAEHAFEGGMSWEAGKAARQEACDWLDAHYPEWRSPSAYWDAP